MKIIIAMFCLLAAVAGTAPESQASLVTFDALGHDDALIVELGPSYQEAGFLFTNTATVASSGFDPSFATLGNQVYGFSGSTALVNDNYLGRTVMTRTGGGSFDLNAISLAELMPFGVQFDVAVTGTSADGSSVTRVFTLDGATGAETFSLGSSFKDVVSVSWDQTPEMFQFDNVDATPTPVPAAAWLLGSGLMGLVGLRRRKQQ